MPELTRGRIILIRHGETQANRIKCFAESDDIPLTSTGIEQAEELALRIQKEFRPTRIFSSEFHRARQTADIVARRLGLRAEVCPDLHERDFGCLRARPYTHMGAMMKSDAGYDAKRRWLWAPEGGETLEAVRERAVAALEKIHASHPQEEVVVVTHGAVMETVAAHLSGDWESATVPPNCGLLIVEL